MTGRHSSQHLPGLAYFVYLTCMEERTFKIRLGTSDIEVAEVEIVSRRDGTIEYELSDGSRIRVAVAPTQILRLVGGYDPDGNPSYLVRHGTVINTVSALEALRKK